MNNFIFGKDGLHNPPIKEVADQFGLQLRKKHMTLLFT